MASIFNRSDRKNQVRMSFQTTSKKDNEIVPELDPKWLRQSNQARSEQRKLLPYNHPKFSRNNKKDIMKIIEPPAELSAELKMP